MRYDKLLIQFFKKTNMVPIIKYGGESIMILVFFVAIGTGKILRIDVTMESAILNEIVLPSVGNLGFDRCWIFQHVKSTKE